MIKFIRGAIWQTALCGVFAIGMLMSSAQAEVAPEAATQKPNILLIVVDDMGYSDLGVYGSEIRTPNIDGLAKKGLQFTDFYVAPSCSPTRSMLLSGSDNHRAGLGGMDEMIYETMDLSALPPPVRSHAARMQNVPGYEGYLNNSVFHLPAILQNAGYGTYMVGKWHIGHRPEDWPQKRGFDHSFALLEGLASHFNDNWPGVSLKAPYLYVEDDQYATLPEDFYSSTTYTDKMIGWLSNSFATKNDEPFFAYFAPTAPHDPLQVPDADLDLYEGQYKDGYEALMASRLERMKELGLVNQDVEGAKRVSMVTPWDDLTDEEKKFQARYQQLYAATLEVLDREIGRLLAFLEENGKLENTVILFMSDNGASPNDGVFFYGFEDDRFDNRYENLGRPNSFVAYGPGWAQAGSVPFNYFKGMTYEGGIRVPMIITGPGVVGTGIERGIAHVTDVAPTLLELAGVDVPEDPAKRPMSGKSLLPILQQTADQVRGEDEYVGWELHGRNAIRQGDWKITYSPSFDGVKWELFNLADDPSEMNDLVKAEPEKFKEMLALWEEYVANNDVILFTWSETLMMKAAIWMINIKMRFFD